MRWIMRGAFGCEKGGFGDEREDDEDGTAAGRREECIGDGLVLYIRIAYYNSAKGGNHSKEKS